MNIDSMDLLMQARSIAVIGASGRKFAMGNTILQNFKRLNYEGSLYGVNPHREEVEGFPCFPSMETIPEPVDVVAIALGRDKVVPALEQAIGAGARAATIFASGFSEVSDGKQLEADLKQVCSEHGVRLVGPNCLGLLSVTNRVPLYSSALPDEMIPGDVAVISQSGSGCLAIICSGRMDFSFVVSSGNEATTTAADYIAFATRDEATAVIAVVVESIRDPQNFAAAVDAALAVNKPVVVLKIGRSAKGMKAATAHTGSLISPFEEYRAFLENHGVIVVDDLDELIETVDLFRRVRSLPAGDGVGVMNLSGGINALICDVAEKVGVDFPVFTDGTQDRLREVLPDFASIGNPLDGTGVAVFDMKMYAGCLETIAADPGVNLVGVSQDMPEALDSGHVETAERVARTVVDAASRFNKPILLMSNVGSSLFGPAADILRAADIPVLQGTHEALLAVSHLCDYARNARSMGPLTDSSKSPLDGATFREVRNLLERSKGPLPAADCVTLFAAYGIDLLRASVAADADQAVEAARRVGYPVALKIESPDIHHKTEVGGVITDIEDERSLRAAFSRMLEGVRRAAPDAHVDGYLVQEMISGQVEAIVGCARSDQFGSMIVVGPGGIFVEVFNHTAMCLVPASPKRLSGLIDQTSLGKLLAGHRGKPQADRTALEELLVKLGYLLIDMGDLIEELDLNPVCVLNKGEGVRILDALVVTNPDSGVVVKGGD